MHIQITGETEKLIRAAIAAGEYTNAEDFVAAMAVKWLRETAKANPVMSRRVDLDALAAAQGVGPIQDFRELEADFWPEGESVGDFLASINEIRDVNRSLTNSLGVILTLRFVHELAEWQG